MSRALVAVVAAMSLLSQACFYTYGGPKTTKQRRDRDGGSTPLPDAVTGRGEIMADGTFVLTLSNPTGCVHQHFVEEQITEKRHRRFGLVAYPILAALAFGVYGGAVLIYQGGFRDNPPDPETGVTYDLHKVFGGGAIGVVSLITLTVTTVFRFVPPSKREPNTKVTVGEWRQIDASREPVACTADQLGKFTLVTPWGYGDGPRTANGNTVTFSIDWASADAVEGRAALVGPWRIENGATNSTKEIQIADASVTRGLELINQAKNRTVKGATPANLYTAGIAPDTGTLAVPGTSTIKLTVENRGGSTARDVTVKTRSSLVQLHDLTFSFGLIQPGKRATKSLSITLPADVTGDNATVILVFSEASGQVPANVTHQLNFTKALCPTKLTRAEYQRKRDKMQKAVGDGAMTQDEFNRLDAELVNCLK